MYPAGMFDHEGDLCPVCSKAPMSTFTFVEEPYPHYVCPLCGEEFPLDPDQMELEEDATGIVRPVTAGPPVASGVLSTTPGTMPANSGTPDPTQGKRVAIQTMLGDEQLDLSRVPDNQLDGMIGSLGKLKVNQSSPLNTGAMGS